MRVGQRAHPDATPFAFCLALHLSNPHTTLNLQLLKAEEDAPMAAADQEAGGGGAEAGGAAAGGAEAGAAAGGEGPEAMETSES